MAQRDLKQVLARPASALLVVMMLAGCMLLWIGVPLVWLWIGSQVQASASLGTALAVTMTGVIVTVAVVVAGLLWLNRLHGHVREARSLPASRQSALEVLFVASAAIATLLFVIWFFAFSGSSPVPVEIGS